MHPRYDKLESNLELLKLRIPELPTASILLSRLLIHLGREMSAMLEQQIRPFGLAEAEFRVLTALFSQPDGVAHPSELCAGTSQSPANMSRISDALVARALITRVLSDQDRRKMVLRITNSGESLVRELLPRLFMPLRESFQDTSEAEQRLLIDQLIRLGRRLDGVHND